MTRPTTNLDSHIKGVVHTESLCKTHVKDRKSVAEQETLQ
uniref:Uncharacterized protein n=1 Tax=Anguilla anguilla TaxID=7936 RepID=A0A0E9RUQ0_ANGAN